MRRLLLSMLVIAGIQLVSSKTLHAQTSAFKVGVFDVEIMMQVMPGYRTVDSLVQTFERDSLGAEYEYLQSEYYRLDSTYKADSAANKAATILNIEKQQRNQIALNLVYWQQISQNKSGQKRAALAQPIYAEVMRAYKKVLDAKKYSLVLKPNSFDFFGSPAVENIFVSVAKELNVTLPEELGGGMAETGAAAKPRTNAPVVKPAAPGAKKPATRN